MLTVRYSNYFEKDYKLMKKRGYKIELPHEVVEMLANRKPLPEKYRDHFLSGDYKRIWRVSYPTGLVIDLSNWQR